LLNDEIRAAAFVVKGPRKEIDELINQLSMGSKLRLVYVKVGSSPSTFFFVKELGVKGENEVGGKRV